MPECPVKPSHLLLIGFFCLHVLCISGQDQRVADSLAIIYQEDMLVGTEKMELLKDLSFNELNDGELSLKYAEELIRLSEQENNIKYLYSGYLQKGNYYSNIGELDLALETYFKTVNIAIESKNLNREGIVYSAIADVYATMENFSNA